jgi:DNA polymerase-1
MVTGVRLVFDVEGNGFLDTVTKLHCAVTGNIDTGEIREFGPDAIPEFLEYIRDADLLSGLNSIRYDFPVLEKLHGLVIPEDRQEDLLVVSRTIKANLKELDGKFNASRLSKKLPGIGKHYGSHSIEAWGVRFGIDKVGADIEDWSVWTPNMQQRCVSDVKIALRLRAFLKPEKFSQEALHLEHRVARLCDRITLAGWPINLEKAHELHAHLVDEQNKLKKELAEQFGGWYENCGEFTPRKPDAKRGYWGEWVEENWYSDKHGEPCEPYVKKVFKGYTCTKIKWVEFNPSSRAHIERCMRLLGWKPKEFTEKGKAKLDDSVIEGLIEEFGTAGGLPRYLMIEKRLGQLASGDDDGGSKAWLSCVSPEGRIHAVYNPMGTVTSRASHFNPNIAQVPAGRNPYGKECRQLFYVPTGWKLVGSDTSGLELRCFAHYLAKHDDGAYGKVVLEGDVHWTNLLIMGALPKGTVRDEENKLHELLRDELAKRFLYAWLYGAGDEKAGTIVLDVCRAAAKLDPVEGPEVYKRYFGDDKNPNKRKVKDVGSYVKNIFMRNVPGLAQMVREVKEVAERNDALPGLDKRRLPVRHAHAALNTLLQSAGAIICKRWICDAHDALIKEGFKWGWDGDFVFVAWIHDELQVAVRDGLGDRVGELLTAAARASGTPYGFRIRLDSKYKIGNDWSETH